MFQNFRKRFFSRPQRNQALSLRNGEQGATAIEYGLIAALIALAAIAAMQSLGTESSAAPNEAASSN